MGRLTTHTRRCEHCGKLFFATVDDEMRQIFACSECRVSPPPPPDPEEFETVRITGILGGHKRFAFARSPVKR